MPNFGLGEWLIVLLIILVLFGATRIPALMKGLGKGVREFKKGINGEDEEEEPKDKKEEGKNK